MIRVLDEEKINRMIDALLALQEREDVTIPALRRQLIETEKGIENLVNAIQQGILTVSTKQRLEELEKQKEELSLSIARAELQKPKLTREYMEHWFSQFRGGSPDDRTFQKRLIDTFVNAVYVYDDKLVLTYNYQHGTQTVTRKEVEDFLSSDLAEMPPPQTPVSVRTQAFFSVACKNRLLGSARQAAACHSLHLCHPQAVEVAVCVDGHGLVVAQAEGHVGRVARFQDLALAAGFGLDIDPPDEMLGDHGVVYAADVDVERAVLHRNDRQVLFPAGFNGIGDQFLHFLPAAYHRNAGVADHTGQVAAAAADVKLCHGIVLLFCLGRLFACYCSAAAARFP